MRALALPVPVIVAFVCGILPAQAADVAEPAPAPEAVVTAPQYNWYIAARIGAASADDTEFGVLGTTVTNDYDTGWVGSAAVGTQFNLGGFRPRAEIEMGYLSNEVDSHDVAGIGRFEGDDAFGKTNVFFSLVNGYLDFLEGPLKPYVSAGLGFGHVDLDNHGITAVGTALVLVVEDEALIQLELEGALHDGGYAAESESSGEAAIAKLEANSPIRALVTEST